jgi:hypothetical protein
MESLQLCSKILVYVIGGVWSLSDIHFVKTLHSVILNVISEINFQDILVEQNCPFLDTQDN